MNGLAGVGLSEAVWQTRILEVARLYGWRAHHARPALRQSGRWSTPITGNPGFPDLVLCGHGRLIVAELKTDTGRIRPEQQQWLNALRQVPGVEVAVWRPADWDAVQDQLRPTYRPKETAA